MRSCPLIFSVSNGGLWKWEEMTSSICVAVMKTTWRGRQSLPNNSQKLDGHLREESFYCGNITWYCLSDRTSHKTRFQMMVSNLSHSVMKNLTEHRMHLEGSKIPQMNLSNHSSQEMSLGENWLFGQENCFRERNFSTWPNFVSNRLKMGRVTKYKFDLCQFLSNRFETYRR